MVGPPPSIMIMKKQPLKKLRPYQKDALKHASDKNHVALLMEMRLGKTLTCLRIMKKRGMSKQKKVLIFTPYSAMLGWEISLEEEGFSNHVRLTGIPKKKLEILDGDYQFYLLNYEGYENIKGQLTKVKWDTVICDEAHNIKGPTSKRTKYITESFRSAKYRFILDGTLDPESELDVYCPLKFLDPSIIANASTYWSFKSKFFRPSGRSGYKFKMIAQYKQSFRKRLAEKCFILKRKDVNLGVEPIEIVRNVSMDAKTRKVYKILEKEFLLTEPETENILDETTSSGTKYQWLRRLSSGHSQDELIWEGKFRELDNIMDEDLPNQPVVIYAHYRNELFALREWATAKGLSNALIFGDVKPIERDQLKSSFQKRKIDVLICQPSTIRYGTDLSEASAIIWFSITPSGVTFNQAKDRIVDVSKTDQKSIYYILTEDTVDLDLFMTMRNKSTRSDMNHKIIQRMKKRNQINKETK